MGISQALAWAVGHDKRQQMGFRVYDEDKLSPMQWAALAGLCDGRSNYEQESKKRRDQQQAPPSNTTLPPPTRR